MSSGYHNRQTAIRSKIRSLFTSLISAPSNYVEITPHLEYWIDYVLREDFLTVDELVEEISYLAWDQSGTFTKVAQFLKEFHDSPHRSEHARTFVTRLCSHVLRWFAITSAEEIYDTWSSSIVSIGGRPGFMHAASSVGHLIEWGLLSHELVQRHLTKPLTSHRDINKTTSSPGAVRAKVIYELFTTAGNTLLQGLLEPDDVQACFDMLDTWCQRGVVFNVAKLKVQYTALDGASFWSLICRQEFREIHSAWMQRKEEQSDRTETEGNKGGGKEDTMETDASPEVRTPVAFIPQDLPTAAIGIEIPSSILQDIGSAFALHHTESSSEAIVDIPANSISSPTFSISTMSDLTPTELGEIENDQEQAPGHDTFYFEDGNVEIVCGDTTFRVHSTIVSFSSSELRKILSRPALLEAPTPEGCPRITISDSAEDFAMLLKMIYTPG